ncbi:methyltransferase [Bradyrhizobium sp.]|uniref:tRNA1(Val) (adenine(37)-N6)-methyltransferase n=1 Tax=Bradyrhizobium sp. TaxID=376 RepID=UPI001ED3424C|nr:methyltransferase [Bradyrhizobium sp.]MBV9978721.1 methyltransferase [Bradyrhizobium sp.]
MNCDPTNSAVVDEAGFTEDAFLGGRLRLRQPRGGHRAGHDAVLLAAATAARPGDRVVDFGAGVGAAGLALARRVAGVDLKLVEIDPQLARLARDNAAANGIKAEIVTLDVTSSANAFAAAGLVPDSADVVLMNPPFHDAGRHRASPEAAKALAHVAGPATLESWILAARRVLKSGSALTLIWRADGLADVLAALAHGFGSVQILPVHGEAAKPAIRVLVRTVKGGRAPSRLYRSLVLNNESTLPKMQLDDVMAGMALLPLAAP